MFYQPDRPKQFPGSNYSLSKFWLNPLFAPSFLAAALLAWYPRHHRDLPWRHTRDPYAIWLSEVILQQTRVAQGLPYYETFLAAYPTVQALAAAPEAGSAALLAGPGLLLPGPQHAPHRPAGGGRSTAGSFPATYAGLLKLRGVGPYTAAAIASFAFDEAVAVLDGNVFRVLARVFGLHSDIAAPSSRKEFQALADQHIPATAPADFNQAIMEFGAIQCTPAKPDCLFCPLQSHCWAFQHGQVAVLPIKRQQGQGGAYPLFPLLCVAARRQIYLRERPAGDIWQGLSTSRLLKPNPPCYPEISCAT